MTSLLLAVLLAGLTVDDPATATTPPAPADQAPAPPVATTPPSPSPSDVTLAPPPNPAAGERPDARLDPLPRRRWRIVPQILMFPFRALFWLVRLPTRPALQLEDRRHPFGRFVSWFTWSDGQRGLRPAFYYSTIHIPEFGLKYFDHLSLGVDTNLSLTAMTGGSRYVYSALSAEPTRASDPFGVIFDVVFDRRGDLLFNGLGSHTFSNAPNGRYLMNGLEARIGLRLRMAPWIGLFATFATGIKRFDNGDNIGGDPPIFSVYDPATIQGFSDGTNFVRGSVGFVVDARDSAARPASGVIGTVAFDYTGGFGGDHAHYPRFRASLGVPINLWWHTHILWLYGATEMAWNNGDTPVPFSELPTLGGPDTLRGFRYQDFRDYSSLFFTGEYRWPAWMWLDGSFFVDYGGVFGQNFAGFGARRMQPDIGFGIRMITSSHFFIRVQLAYGFGEGFNFAISGNSP